MGITRHEVGFTLVETLVLVMVLALTLSLGIPAFNTMTSNSRMSAAANTLVSGLHAARSEALTRSRSVTLCASSDWDTAEPACDASAALLAGWIMFVDIDSDGLFDDDELLLQAHAPLHESILDAPRTSVDGGTPQYLSFRADSLLQDIPGRGAGIGNIQLCDGRGNRTLGGGRAAGRWITLSPAGRPTLIDRAAQLQDSQNPLGGC